MGLRFFLPVSITAGQQALGTELTARRSRPNTKLLVREIVGVMGAEAKTWRVRKRFTQNGSARSVVLYTSVDATGTPAAVTDTSMGLNGEDAPIAVLLAGEEIQIETAGASSAMEFRVQYEEVPNEFEPRLRDPRGTR